MEEIIINPDLDIEVDPEFSVEPLCECGTCRDCIKNQIFVQEEIECTCAYKEVVEIQTTTDEEGNEIEIEVKKIVVDVQCDRCKEIERLKSILEKYDVLEDAYIDESKWQEYVIYKGMIFESQETLDKYLNPQPSVPQKTINQQVSDLEIEIMKLRK